MNELDVSFSLASPQDKDIPIDISVSDIEEDMIYRFCVGINGVWYTIQDFSTKKEVTWVPEEYGNYISSILGTDFNGIIKEGVSIFQVYAFYGEPDKYFEKDNLLYLYYQDSYIIFDNQGLVVSFENNGYFMTEDDLNSINN